MIQPMSISPAMPIRRWFLAVLVSVAVLLGAAPAVGADTRRSEQDAITRLYQAYMLRTPDDDGSTYWTAQHLSCALSLDVISQAFASSSEFRARYGTLSNRQFVELVYQNVLGRAGEPGGVAYWTAQLDAGASRGAVMIGFSESNEYVVRTGTVMPQPSLCTPRFVSDSVVRLYQAYMLRQPDASGERHWIGEYAAGRLTLEAISQAFASSSEFRARYGTLSNRQFVELVYQNVLGRAGEPGGVAYWTAQLDAGASRGAVMIGFSESNEHVFRTRTASPAPVGWTSQRQTAGAIDPRLPRFHAIPAPGGYFRSDPNWATNGTLVQWQYSYRGVNAAQLEEQMRINAAAAGIVLDQRAGGVMARISVSDHAARDGFDQVSLTILWQTT